MTAEEIAAQLARILSSPVFAPSPRLSAFLRHVVTASQQGQADSLKEYSIGVEVFDRGADFDPRIDNIVRVQAAKLRSKLLEYYTQQGQHDPVVIAIPKGSYAPEFREQARTEQPSDSARRSHIAVLPFVNMSSDPENEYFSDGLTEELINRLASAPGIHVVARTSAFRFKGRNEDLREVGAKLNVGTVMEGSVRKSGDQLRVTAQLIDVESGYHLFSRTYHRSVSDLFAIQDEIAQKVADEVAPRREGQSSRIAAHPRAKNLDAYNVYLRAMYSLANRFNDFHQCIALFREAIRMEPAYAPAWAGLAYAYLVVAWFYQMPSDAAMPLCQEAALRTLELDGESALGHGSLALYECGFAWRWASAETRFSRAIELNPGLTMIYPFYAFCCLLPQSKKAEACDMVERALSQDPFNGLGRATATYAYGVAGRYEEALLHNAVGLEMNAGFPPVLGSGGLVQEWKGRLDSAIPVYRQGLQFAPDTPFQLSILGHALARSGEKQEAREILQRLLRHPSQPEVDIATVHLGLENTDETLRWLESAAECRNLHLLTVPSDPRFVPLREHPRFRDILRRMGLS